MRAGPASELADALGVAVHLVDLAVNRDEALSAPVAALQGALLAQFVTEFSLALGHATGEVPTVAPIE
jgi:hypothetical protein